MTGQAGEGRLMRITLRAAARFSRRRRAWQAATGDVYPFHHRVSDHEPSWTLVDQANDLLLRLGRAEVRR